MAEHLAESGANADLGIIPLGTGNLLARNLGVPLKDLTAAFERALTGEAIPLDIGWARLAVDGETDGKRYAFAVMAGFGIDAHMIAETDDDLKDKAGWLAYAEAMGRAVAASEIVDVTLTLDDGRTKERSGHTLLIGNCGMIQGGLTLLPDAEPDDGKLDLLLVSADGAAAWMHTLRAVVWENGIRRLLGGDRQEPPASTDHAHYDTAEHIEVTLASPQPFEIDGEEAGKVSSYSVRVQPGAVRVLC